MVESKIYGIGSKVFNKFGINTVLLSSKKMSPGLKRGNIVQPNSFIRMQI